MSGLVATIKLDPSGLAELAKLIASKMKEERMKPYSPQEAAEALGGSKTTVERRVKAGVYPEIPQLGKTRIPASFINGPDRRKNPVPWQGRGLSTTKGRRLQSQPT